MKINWKPSPLTVFVVLVVFIGMVSIINGIPTSCVSSVYNYPGAIVVDKGTHREKILSLRVHQADGNPGYNENYKVFFRFKPKNQ